MIPLRSTGLDVRKVAFIWNIMMNPLYINIEDISNVLFDMIIGVSNFNAQQIAFGHMVEN